MALDGGQDGQTVFHVGLAVAEVVVHAVHGHHGAVEAQRPVAHGHGDVDAAEGEGHVVVVGIVPLAPVGLVRVGPGGGQAEGIQPASGPAGQLGVHGAVAQVVAPGVAHGRGRRDQDLALQAGTGRGAVQGVVQEGKGLLEEFVHFGGHGVHHRHGLVGDAVAILVRDIAQLQRLFIGLLEQHRGGLRIVTGDGVHGRVEVVVVVFQVDGVEVHQGLLGLRRIAVVGRGLRIVDIGVAQEGVTAGALRRNGRGHQFAVDGNGAGAAEAFQHLHLQIGGGGVEIGGGFALVDYGLIAVEEQEENGLRRGHVVVFAVAVLVEVLRLQAVSGQLAGQEHLAHGVGFADILQVDVRGLVHLIGLAIDGIHIFMVAIVPAIPVFVLHKVHGLIRLVIADAIGAIGGIGVRAGAVGARPHGAGGRLRLLQALVVQVGLHQVLGAHAIGGEVEAFQRAGVHEGQLIFAAGVKAHVVEAVVLGKVLVHDQQVVVQVGVRLAPVRVGGGDAGEQGQVLVRAGRDAVLVRHCQQVFPGVEAEVVLAIGFHIGLQRVAAGPIQRVIDADVHQLVAHHILAFVVLGHVGDLHAFHAVVQVAVAAGQRVSLGVHHRVGAGVAVGGAVVQQLGIQHALEGFHKVNGLDGGAVFPGQILAQLHAPGVTAGGGFRDIELRVRSLDFLRHVHGHLGGHVRHDDVGVEGLAALNLMVGIVEDEAVQAGRGVIQRYAVILRLIGVRIPARGQGANRHAVRVLARNGLGQFRHGFFRGFLRYGAKAHGKHHGKRQQQCEELLHVH